MVAKRHARYLSSSHVERQQPMRTALYSCSSCHSELFDQRDIMSRAFQGRHGQAFLIRQVVNVSVGDQEERMLMTGLHTVADISCSVCCFKIGWVYLKSPETHQQYKENKFIIEKVRVIKE